MKTDSKNRELIYGRQPVQETLLSGKRQVYSLRMLATAKESAELIAIVKQCEKNGITISKVDKAELQNLVGSANHQGLVIEVSRYNYTTYNDLIACIKNPEKPPFLAVLDHIVDPQNLGSILRTAEAAGVDAVIIPKDRAAEVSPAVVRASAGASEHMKVIRVVNIVQTMKDLKDVGLWFTGLEAIDEAKKYDQLDYKDATGIVIGSEGAGLGRLVRESCDFLARLPLGGKISSLNANAAAAVILYEVRRQRDVG